MFLLLVWTYPPFNVKECCLNIYRCLIKGCTHSYEDVQNNFTTHVADKMVDSTVDSTY